MTAPGSIGRYRVDRRIGKGGMAVIYLAYDPHMKRVVAIKMLPRRSEQEAEFIARFEREVDTLTALEHPAIVPIYDYGLHENQPYYVMRYMPGGSLADRLKRGALSLPDTAAFIRQIAPALDAAHRRSIVHRDIKPGNILFDRDNHAYLSDFGIVQVASDGTEISGGEVMGTPSYMSPELARGDADVDGRSDIYAVGVLLFRAWTGVTPFTANTPMGIAMKHVSEPVPDILAFKPDLPPACGRVIQTAMAKNREERFATTVALAEALELVAAGVDWHPVFDEDTTRIDTGAGSAALGHIRRPPDAGPPTNLPAPTSSFIGRETALARIADLLDSEDCRLLTLLGPGGIGKTRLALETARQRSAGYADGVFFVPLAPLQTDDRIIHAIAEHIGFEFYGETPREEQLANYLRRKDMLLVIDNFEHLMAQSHVLSDLLTAGPGLRLLVTSRTRLNLKEEWIIQVHGMNMPPGVDGADLAAYPAIELLRDRIRRSAPDFDFAESDLPYAVRICQLIEGSPLGIELAAGWTRFLSLAEIASEIETSLDFLTSSLRNVSPRHRSLRAVFNYSWGLLDSEERRVFASLSVFTGGFTRSAAAQVTGAGTSDLAALTDKSLLVRQQNGRFEMPEVIRQYAEEQLAADPEAHARIHIRFSEYFLAFIGRLRADLEGRNQQTALESLRAENSNLLVAWRWAVTNGLWDAVEAAFRGLYRYLEFRGRIVEAHELFTGLAERLAVVEAPSTEIERLLLNAKARKAAFLYRIGRANEALELAAGLLPAVRDTGSAEDLGFLLTYLGAAAYLAGNATESAGYLIEAIQVLEATPDRIGVAIATHHLALLELDRDNLDDARRLFNDSLIVNRKIGNLYGEGISLNNLGNIACEQGKYDEAHNLHNLSLEIRKQLDDRWGIANVYDGLGLVAQQRGNFIQARDYFSESLSIYLEIGDVRRARAAETNLGHAEASLTNNP